ncbi:type II toxin-antitoxin system RelE/ParE family toxin [Blastopirellula retiformator]|uniref:type II toxin-antitoxin system RelE/ParE family toxin n=1 Tax=Blastopirellula retiformator TaxID=2527970 RepID=UPI0036F3953A
MTQSVEKINELLTTLENHPQRGDLAAESEEIGQEIREVLLGHRRYKHRILFQVSSHVVTILRVRHSSRDSFTREYLS